MEPLSQIDLSDHSNTVVTHVSNLEFSLDYEEYIHSFMMSSGEYTDVNY